jgi:hypothetical protein
MATAEVALQVPDRRRRHRGARYFFAGMSLLATAIVLAAFVPEFVKFAAGTFPIPLVLHVHAAIMMTWLAAFALQAYLGLTRQTALHRRLGPYAVAAAIIAWLSMVFVEMRALMVHPIPTTVRDLDWMLPGPLVYLSFPIFLAWAVHERRRPQWHKRLMTFALFLPLLAPIERFLWIPANEGFLPFLAVLDLCLLAPLLGYDLFTLKGRLHPATVRATLLLLAGEAMLVGLWGTDEWHRFALVVVDWIHR